MALFPLVSNVEGDFVLQLLPVDTDDTMDQVAEKAAYHSIGRRVGALSPGVQLRVAQEYRGVNTNILTDEQFVDPVSGNVALNGVPVTVEPA